jgi:hypothetical protein
MRPNRTVSQFRKACVSAAALFCSAAVIVQSAAAQMQEAPAIQLRSGFQLDSVSAYSAYYSDGFAANLVPLQSSPLAPDFGMGAAATLTWIRATERSDLSLTYSADYSARVRYSSWDALNHRFSMNANRHLTPLWDFRFAVGASVTTTDQLVLLNGQPLEAAPASASLLLYGNRMLSSTALMSLIYKLSSRTSLTWQAGGMRYQGLGSNAAGTQAGAVSWLNQTTTANAGFDVSHSISSRTQVDLILGTNRILSGLLDIWSQSGSVSLRRALSPRWFTAVRGGGGFIYPMRPIANLVTRPQYLAGGTVGYRAPAHTLQVSIDRTVGDTYGLGAPSTISALVSWTFSRPGSPWSFRTSAGEQQLESGVLASFRTRQIALTLGRALTPNLQLTAEYGYMQYSGASFGTISPTAVRLAMVWRPGPGLLH